MIEVTLSKRNIENPKFLQSVGFMKLAAYHQVPEKIKMFHKLLRLISEKYHQEKIQMKVKTPKTEMLKQKPKRLEDRKTNQQLVIF